MAVFFSAKTNCFFELTKHLFLRQKIVDQTKKPFKKMAELSRDDDAI
jgi:hypothetical protein